MIGLSPLSTGHPIVFQHYPVRASIRFYSNFTLPMDRSPGFGSTPYYLNALFRLAFASASALTDLTLQHKVTRRLILQKACRHPHMELRHLVSLRFQVLFHSPSGVLFTFPSRYSFTIGHRMYLALRGGPRGFRPGYTCRIVLRKSSERLAPFAYGTITLYGRTFQTDRLGANFVTLWTHSGRPEKLLQHPCYNALKL